MSSPVIVALDYPDAAGAEDLVRRLSPRLCRLKVGKQLFTAAGPGFVESLAARGYDVFLDLKYHDIPNTTAAACRAAADLGVWMLNVHALGGRRMLTAAAEAVAAGASAPLLIAVTVLTSLTRVDLAEVGIDAEPDDLALALGRLALNCGLDGLVCSAREAPTLRAALGETPLLVSPGIRPPGAAGDDQRRTATPAEAMRGGSSYLVIGRPVTRADDPVAALEAILASVGS